MRGKDFLLPSFPKLADVAEYISEFVIKQNLNTSILPIVLDYNIHQSFKLGK